MENLKPDHSIVDLAIIGGGPAGSSAALEARRQGLRVALWEKDRFPRDKVCGEFISSEALPLLQDAIAATVARGTAIRYTKFIAERGARSEFRLPGNALGLSRRLLDAALWDAAAAAGVEAHQGESIRRVRKLVTEGLQGVQWEIESSGGSIRKARELIVASGRWWSIEGLHSPVRESETTAPGNWIGAKAHFAGITPRRSVEMYFFRGGYCGLAPVEDFACNVCCLVHRERLRESGAKGLDDFASWLAQIAQSPALARRLRGAVQASPTVTTAPVIPARRHAVQGGALMAGDASGFLDPFTGEGISVALHSGTLAAQSVAAALLEGRTPGRAAEMYARNLAQAVKQSYRIAAMARGLMLGPVWLRALGTAPLPWIGKRLVRETRWRRDRAAKLG